MEQITIFQWQQWKEDIRIKLQEAAEDFVYIGYRLKQIIESEAYKQDGYEDIYSFAQEEYGLSKSVTSRFIAINNKFSIDGNSEKLKEEYIGLGSSKLAEMLTLPDADCQLITERTTVQEIRDIKRFNREEPQEQDSRQYSPLEKCIIDYFSDQKRMDNLNEIIRLLTEEAYSVENEKQAYYEVNPSGYATHKKGIIFLFMYDFETGIKYKSLTETEPHSMSCREFLTIISNIYSSYFDPEEEINNIWTKFYGKVVAKEPEKEEEKTPEHTVKSSNSVATSQQEKEENQVEEKEDAEGETEELEEIEQQESEETEEDPAEDEDEQGEDVEEEEEESELPEGVEEPPLFKLILEARELSQLIYLGLMEQKTKLDEEILNVQKHNAQQLAAVLEQMIEIKREVEE